MAAMAKDWRRLCWIAAVSGLLLVVLAIVVVCTKGLPWTGVSLDWRGSGGPVLYLNQVSDYDGDIEVFYTGALPFSAEELALRASQLWSRLSTSKAWIAKVEFAEVPLLWESGKRERDYGVIRWRFVVRGVNATEGAEIGDVNQTFRREMMRQIKQGQIAVLTSSRPASRQS